MIDSLKRKGYPFPSVEASQDIAAVPWYIFAGSVHLPGGKALHAAFPAAGKRKAGKNMTIEQCYQQLHLELTESAYTENPGQIITMVDELRRRGFVIEMDDFGSGYSSLNMLSQVRFDILKLDMQFIQTETAKPGEMSLMRFAVKLAKWMNLSTVAEGVETKAQVERLREVGCDYAQGYFFSRPLPVEKFEALMKQELAGGKTEHTH